MVVFGMTYRRSKSGKTVHRSDCRFASPTNSLPWNWADGFTPQLIDAAIRANVWLRPCQRCQPHRDLSASQ